MMHDPLNKVIMQEIGLTVDKQNRVYDQDTRQPIMFKEKYMKYSSQNNVSLGNNDILFDPANNKGLMSSLFDYYTQKLEDEEGIYVAGHFEKEDDGKMAISMSINEGQISTNAYSNGCLSYLEAVQILNGSNQTDLTKFDTDKFKQPVQKKRIRKKKKGVLE